MPDNISDKTEAPTPRRRAEMREQGDIARSPDLTAGLMLLGAVVLLGAFGQATFESMMFMLESMLDAREGSLGLIVRDGQIAEWSLSALHLAGKAMAPFAVGLLVLGLFSGIIQVGFLVTAKPLAPNFARLSPLKGFAQLFSMRAAMRLVMSLLKVAVVVAVAAYTVWFDIPQIVGLIKLEPGAVAVLIATLVYTLAIRIAVVLLLLGIMDYAYQRWQKEQEMKMTKHEVKEEFKRMEGDPLVKQRRARVARQLALQRIAQDVPRADVVITNPTHFAVALKYDGDEMTAPKVLAKGADHLALRIRQIAVANAVPIVERPTLARALYRAVEPGQEISPEFYTAVAEILAYVYRLKDRRTA